MHYSANWGQHTPRSKWDRRKVCTEREEQRMYLGQCNGRHTSRRGGGWKSHRPYQAHGRVRIPRKVDVIDWLNGMYRA